MEQKSCLAEPSLYSFISLILLLYGSGFPSVSDLKTSCSLATEYTLFHLSGRLASASLLLPNSQLIYYFFQEDSPAPPTSPVKCFHVRALTILRHNYIFTCVHFPLGDEFSESRNYVCPVNCSITACNRICIQWAHEKFCSSMNK